MTEVRKMLNVEDVLAMVPVSRTTLWRMVQAGSFGSTGRRMGAARL